MKKEMREELNTIITKLKSVSEILFAIQLLDDGSEQLKIETALDLPIMELDNICSQMEDIVNKHLP